MDRALFRFLTRSAAGRQGHLSGAGFTVPQELIEKNPDVTLVAKVNGVEVARQNYRKADRYLLASKVPPEALKRLPAEVEFAVDQSVADPGKGRTLGLIVVSVGLKEYEQTAEFRDAQLAESQKAYEKVLQQRESVPLHSRLRAVGGQLAK